MSRFFARFLYPIRVSAGANVIVTSDGSITVPPGTYYLRSEAGGETDRYPSLFQAISDAALSAIGDDAVFSWFAPTGYRYKESLSIRWAGPFAFLFGDPGFTFPPEYLGFPPDINSNVATVNEGGGFFIHGTRSALGSWIGGTVDGGDWSSINSHIEKEIYASTSPIYEHTKIIRMRDDRVPRVFEFEEVPGLRVQGGEVRGSDIGYRETANLAPITDGFNSDGAAVSLREMYRRVNGGQEFLVLYEDEDETGLVDGKWEGVRLGGAAFHESFQEWYTMTRPGGEFYDVSFLGLVVAGGYDY